MADYSTRLRLDQPTRQRLDEVVAAGHYRSNNAAVVDAINRLWEELRQDDLDAAYAAAVADNPSYPYESEAERATARTRRNDARRFSAPITPDYVSLTSPRSPFRCAARDLVTSRCADNAAGE